MRRGSAGAEEADGATFYRLDEWHHRIAVYEADNEAVRAVGWQVDDEGTLNAMAECVRGADVEVEELTDLIYNFSLGRSREIDLECGMFLANLEVVEEFQLIYPCNMHGFVDFFLRWNAQPVGGNGSKTPEVDEGGNGRVESAAAYLSYTVHRNFRVVVTKCLKKSEFLGGRAPT